jgi:hypothetical protein
LENGKGVVADAGSPRTMPSQITPVPVVSHAPFYAILAHAARFGAKQTQRVLMRVLCHNMCGPIRVTRELGVEMTRLENRSQPELFVL